jgi:hypothetical protein
VLSDKQGLTHGPDDRRNAYLTLNTEATERELDLETELENVNLKWPHRDGLKWPHPGTRCSISRHVKRSA